MPFPSWGRGGQRGSIRRDDCSDRHQTIPCTRAQPEHEHVRWISGSSAGMFLRHSQQLKFGLCGCRRGPRGRRWPDHLMANFEQAVKALLVYEGGYVNNPNDAGGETRWGISTRWLKRAGLERVHGNVKDLTREKAVELYQAYFWEPYPFHDWPEHGQQRIAEKLFDATVNMGPGQAMKCFQRALRSCGQPFVDDDGVYGPITKRGKSEALSVLGEATVVVATRSEIAGFYRGLVAAKSSQSVFLEGWLRRAYSE